MRERLVRVEECGAGPEESSVGSREEHGGASPEFGEVVSAGLGNAFDQAVQPQATEVVRDHAAGQLVGGKTE